MGIVVPKGVAVALHLAPEYRQGLLAGAESYLAPDRPPKTPYDFFDAYAQHYAWDIGFQVAGNRIRERGLSPAEVQKAREKGAEALFRLLGIEGEEREEAVLRK